jgi:hypothetical protein
MDSKQIMREENASEMTQVAPAAGKLSVRQWAFVAVTLLTVAIGISALDARKGRIRNDFTNYSLAASRVLFAGGNPYSKQETSGKNYKYFPLNATLLGPLTLVPIPVAQGIWTAINVGLLMWCFWLHRGAALPSRAPRWVWVASLAIVGSFIIKNLALGQWNTSVYCLTFAGLALARERPWKGAAVLGLAAALKYMPAFFILYFAVRRQWKAMFATALAMAFWVLIAPSLVLGPQRNIELLHAFRAKARDSYGKMTSKDSVVGQSLRSTLYAYLTPALKADDDNEHLIRVFNLPSATALLLVRTLSIALLAGVSALSAWRRARHPADPPVMWLLEAGAWFLVILLISPEVRKAHLITTFTPLFALGLVVSQKAADVRMRRIAIWSLATMAVCVTLTFRDLTGSTISNLMTLYGSITLGLVALFTTSFYLLAANKTVGRLDGMQ